MITGDSRQYFVMNRKGDIKLSESAVNQCKGPGHLDFEYRVKLLFRNKLDQNGFLIEHEEVNAAIQQAVFAGSCEQLAQEITKALVDLLVKKHQLPLLASKVIINPKPEGVAFMEHWWVKSRASRAYAFDMLGRS